jgi:hypothetical protein
VILNGCGSERPLEPVTVTKHAEDIKRLSSTSQVIDYSRYTQYSACQIDVRGEYETAAVDVESVMALLLARCDRGIPVEPLNLLSAYAVFYFRDKGRTKGIVYLFDTSKDELVIKVEGKWYLLEGQPKPLLADIQFLYSGAMKGK